MLLQQIQTELTQRGDGVEGGRGVRGKFLQRKGGRDCKLVQNLLTCRHKIIIEGPLIEFSKHTPMDWTMLEIDCQIEKLNAFGRGQLSCSQYMNHH